MLGKASEIHVSNFLNGRDALEGFLRCNPNRIILQIIATTYEENDYFYVIYKDE